MKDEFAAIWNAQAVHHPERLLTADAREKIANALFHQRPLKPVKAGRCTFNPTEERMLAAMPSVGDAGRIYQDVNELRYGEELDIKMKLTQAQRDALVSILLMGNKISWDKLRTSLKLSRAQCASAMKKPAMNSKAAPRQLFCAGRRGANYSARIGMVIRWSAKMKSFRVV